VFVSLKSFVPEPILDQKRAAAKKALLSKKQNFETAVRTFDQFLGLNLDGLFLIMMFFVIFDFHCRHPPRHEAVRNCFIIWCASRF
jgi:hypothetical protein